MKAAFIHDHYFYPDPHSGEIYDGSGGVYNKRLWKRYLAVFESLTVFGRQATAMPEKIVPSNWENVDFFLIRELRANTDRFFKRHIIKKRLKDRLQNIDFAIIRMPSVLGYIAQDICIGAEIPYVLEIVGCPWDACRFYGHFAGKFYAPFAWLALRNATSKSPGCIYVTDKFLQKRYPSKYRKVAISNAYIEDIIDTEVVDNFYDSFIRNPDMEFKIGMIGTFSTKFKGHDIALRALKDIIEKKSIKNIKLYLVGTGDAEWIRTMSRALGIQEYVKIVGTLNSGTEGVLPFIDSMHLCIHPSRHEGLPRVVIEALSRGRLTLGSSIAGIPELLPPRFIHPTGNWKILSKQIVEVFNSPDQWREWTRINMSRAKDFLENNLQSNRVKFLSEIIENSHKTKK